jgi:hypothetical protein
MAATLKRMDVERASDDLRRRTLGGIPRTLDRFIYLASTRDYNTGLYYHDGLASQFSADVVCEALANCHREAFHLLIAVPLEDLVDQMQGYMASSQSRPQDFVAVWKGLEPYRVAVPVETDPFSAEFLFSNFKVALAIVEERLQKSPRSIPDA